MRAMTLACMERTVECDWRKRGWGLGETNPHPKHALERRQYPLCGCEILSVYPPTDYTRQQRSAYGHTHADRPSASKCRRLLGKLEAARRTARGSRATPFSRRPPVRACATSDANLRPGSRVRHALASRARRCPMDAPRRLASRPRHVRDGTARRMRARHPTRNRVYTLATPRGIEIRIRTKQTNSAPAPAHQNREVDFLGRKMGGCLPGGPSPALRLEAKGVA